MGGGSQEQALRRRVEELGLRHVQFAGRVAPDQIHRYYDAADIYIQTPAIDNMPLSVLEAFAAGTPVISTNAGGVPAILDHGVHGLLVPPDDDRAMAEAALRLLDDDGLARRLSLAARAATDAYTWARVRPLWLSAYRSLASPAPRPATQLERA